MAKLPQKNPRNSTNSSNGVPANGGGVAKVKRTRRTVPRDSPPQRSSIYRGVTRHRWTGRYEAHLWDKNCWNESQNKKGRQVYLGAYDDEEAAAHAYDLAALKYWGQETILNFPVATYEKEFKEMERQSREEYIGSLRRKSSGFSRGVSKYRGVARHHHNGRWEARIGRVFGNKYLYLGTYATQEEAAIAYDMAAIEYRGLNAVTNFDLSRYVKWLKPDNNTNPNPTQPDPNPDQTLTLNLNPDQTLTLNLNPDQTLNTNPSHEHELEPSYLPLLPQDEIPTPPGQLLRPTSATSALGLLLQSSKFREMMEMTSSSDSTSSSSMEITQNPNNFTKCSFPEEIQTYFECQELGGFPEGDDMIFNSELNTFVTSLFNCEFEE